MLIICISKWYPTIHNNNNMYMYTVQ
jgi:hypothetical protein